MRKKNWWRLAILIGIAASGFLTIAWLTRTDRRINRESYQKIRAGLTMQEVIDLMGCPPHRRPGEFLGLGGTIATMTIERRAHVWMADNVGIFVVFDAANLATDAKMYATGSYYVSPEETLTQNVRRWLRQFVP